MKKTIVFVTGFEANDSRAVSWWDWFFSIEDAIEKFKENIGEKQKTPDAITYIGEVEVDEDDSLPMEDKMEDINGQIELFLGEHDYENAFPKENNVFLILGRKLKEQDCTEEESAEIKGFIKEQLLPEKPTQPALLEIIRENFPQEFSEAHEELFD